MNMEIINIKKSIECVLFISEKPVPVETFYKLFPDSKKSEIRQCLAELVVEWRELERGFMLHEVAGGYQLRTRNEYSDVILKYKQLKPYKLSRAALEVLAIIAYRHPITRVEIDRIRGVDSSGVVGILLDKELIEIKGRKEVLGRPFLYAITDKFLETFSLKSLDDLPTLKEIDGIDSTLNEQTSVRA